MRPQSWKTIEEPSNLLLAIKKVNSKILIIDCINFWLANVLSRALRLGYQVVGDFSPVSYITSFCQDLENKKNIDTIFIISNEVGMSLVPPNKAGREFQELLSKVNQIIAGHSAEVCLMVARIPVRVK